MDNRVYTYAIDQKTLKIDVNSKKNHAIVYFEGKTLYEFKSYETLSKGKKIKLSKKNSLFIKFINRKEGFTVMANNRHVEQSAGHPKRLMKHTLTPLFIGCILFALQFTYVLYDLYSKGELTGAIISVKTVLYLSYHITLLFLSVIACKLALKGDWKGAFIGFSILLFNFVFSISLGFYFNTGFNLFLWFFLVGQAFVLVLLYSKSSIVKYVYEYSKKR